MKNFLAKTRNLDHALFRLIFRVKWAPLTVFMRSFTVIVGSVGSWGVVAGVAFLFTGWRISHLLIPWSALTLSWGAAKGAKRLSNRTRPFLSHTEIAPLVDKPSSSSLPSGHSATAAAGSVSLIVLYPSYAPIFLVCSLLVAYSRVYLGVHYPFDVLAGFSIGTLSAILVLIVSSCANG